MTECAVLKNNHLDRVICQLRYNPIFSLESRIGEFQSAIGPEYPVSGVTIEPPIPLFPTAPVINNYSFGSQDGHWTVNITNSFITLSCNRYISWDEFESRLGYVLDAFFKYFEVKCFERVGLRYINTIRPSKLRLESTPGIWSQILNPKTIGPMDLFTGRIDSYTSRVDASLDDCRVTSSIGTIRFNDDGEIGFLIDNDLYQEHVNRDLLQTNVSILNARAYDLLERMTSKDLRRRME